MEILILTGMSGAGKTHAANTLEDLGYYCVDNMPALMITEFVNLYQRIPDKVQSAAFVIDVRGEREFDTLIAQLEILKPENTCGIIFLDCADEVIITRYKESRRIHPLTSINKLPIREAIARERALLAEAKQKADFVVDTTKTTVYQLKERLTAIVKRTAESGISINCMSFGFKYGVPSEADLVFDVRCFPNPFYIEELRHKTGLDEDVADYVLSHGATLGFIEKLKDITSYLMPLYISEGRANLIIAIGCTGGKHRSVCISEVMKKYLSDNNYGVNSIHRDIGKS
ncbi:MAG: RNase adapter RapZ [Oscillospiraceae bacterium]|nr:RNase adapter RapZ [Oscillospiraceae bacterium]